MFSQRCRVASMQTAYLRLLSEGLAARTFSAGLLPGIFTESIPSAAKRISALPQTRAACALPRREILLQLVQNRPDRTGLPIRGRRDRHEARRRHCGNHEAGGD